MCSSACFAVDEAHSITQLGDDFRYTTSSAAALDIEGMQQNQL
jgi:superfamily II DNA helicase RecQ